MTDDERINKIEAVCGNIGANPMTTAIPKPEIPQPYFYVVKGCVCPPTSEQTCQAADCPRKGSPFITKYGTGRHTT